MAPCGIGFGHAARLVSIANRLRGRVRIIFSSYGDAVRYVRAHGYPCIDGKPVHYELNELGGVDIKLTVARGVKNIYRFIRQVGDELYFMGTLAPDLVLSDSRASTVMASRVYGVTTILIINQLRVVLPTRRRGAARDVAEETLAHLLNNVWEASDYILIPDFPPPFTISGWTLDAPSTDLRFVGPIITRWPEEVRAADISDIVGDSRLVLVTLTGVAEERKHLLKWILPAVVRASGEVDAFFLVSEGTPTRESRFRRVSDRVMVTEWLPNKYELLKSSDVVVTHGGHTSVVEAIVYGVPALHVPTPGHTERYLNSRTAERLGVARVVTIGPGFTEDFVAALKALMSDEYLDRVRELSARLARYRGDIIISKLVLSLLGKL